MGKIKPLYDNCLVSCVIASDTHLDVLNPLPWLPMLFLKKALKDSTIASRRQDAFIIDGDMTSDGNSKNWALFLKCFEKFPSPAESILLPIGNHDTWNDEGFEKSLEEYFRGIETITGEKRDVTYFSRDINGYKFIFMGSTYKVDGFAGLGEEELNWIESEIAIGSRDSKPVFVFNHEPLNYTHGLPKTGDKDIKEVYPEGYAGIGEESDRVKSILEKYPDVYFITGHSHMGFAGEKTMKTDGYSSFEKDGGFVRINIPSNACGNFWGENNRTCVGLVLEVYSDRVVIRLRDFIHRKWINNVKIQNGKTYFEKKTN